MCSSQCDCQSTRVLSPSVTGEIYRVTELIERSTGKASNVLKGSVVTQGDQAAFGSQALTGQHMGTHAGVVVRNKAVKTAKDDPATNVKKVSKQISQAKEEAEGWDGRLEKAGVSRGLRAECAKATEGFIKSLTTQHGELKYFIDAYKACQ